MERDHLEDLSLDGSILLIYTCKKWDGRGMDWLRIGTGGGCLLKR